MPLTACPTCEKSISKKAVTCPNCGEPDPFNRQVISKTVASIIWLAMIIGGAYAFWVYGVPMLVDFAHGI